MRLLPLLSESRCRLGLVTLYGKLFLQLKLNDDGGLEATKFFVRGRHETNFSLLITPNRNTLKIIELSEFTGEYTLLPNGFAVTKLNMLYLRGKRETVETTR